MSRQINDAGFKLLKSLEGCKLTAYQDQGGVWTIGYGSTPYLHPEICKGLTITQDQADQYLREDLVQFETIDNYLSELVNDNQFSALVCLCYNVGLRAVKLSQTLKLINVGENPTSEWMGFCKVDGVRNQGLVNRRKLELKLYATID